MHAPPAFRVEDPERLWATVRELGFGTVFSTAPDGAPYATLAPFLVREGRLFGHVARANPQAPTLGDGRALLCQFVGSHAYVSPSWYARPGQVPTWNFVQVQVRGAARAVTGSEARMVVEETVRANDAVVGPDDMRETIDRLLGGIAAFEVTGPVIEGSWKLSQNKTAADRAGVVAGLRASGGAAERAVADLMEGSGGGTAG